MGFKWKELYQNGIKHTLEENGSLVLGASEVNVDFVIDIRYGKPEIHCKSMINRLKPLSGDKAIY